MADVSFDPSRVIVIVGPTGSGKSDLALTLGADLDAEIVCMDSMQLYCEMRIGTARPTDEELERLPHHLFGSVSLNEQVTTLSYSRLAATTIADIQRRGKVAMLVGGTGLYMRALFEGMAPLPKTPEKLRQRISERLQSRGLPRLYALLCRLDPRGGAHLHPNDSQRIQRFLEVRLLTGESMLDLWERQEIQTQPMPLTLGLQVERSDLLVRLQHRAISWLRRGWIEETQRLIDAGLMERVLQVGPIGYREISQHLNGSLSKQEMEDRIFIATRQYAKRQMTWFRKASYIQWFPFDPNSGYNMESITGFIKKKWGNRPILSID